MSENESVYGDDDLNIKSEAAQALKDKILNSGGSSSYLKNLANISSAFPGMEYLSRHNRNLALIADVQKKADLLKIKPPFYNSLSEKHSLIVSLAEKYSPIISLAESQSLMTSALDRGSIERAYSLSMALTNLGAKHYPLINNTLLSDAHRKLYASLESLAKKNKLFSNSEAIIRCMSNIISDDDISPIMTLSDDEVATYKSKLSDIESVNSEADLKAFFNSLSGKFKKHFLLIFWVFILPSFISLYTGVWVSLITPAVQNYLDGSNKSNKEKVHDIRKLIATDVGRSQVRFITKDIVYLRDKPSQKSNVLDELKFGQVVAVHSKNKNWIEVSYQYEGGEIVRGWVFTRYTERFKW